jgi:NAD(P)-dependent dehydrogenase (short-subunit alcohol dehydrogenase family)
MFEFSGKTVLVTGGTSGIGRAVATAFLAAGADVIAAALPAGDPLPPQIKFALLNVTDDSAVAKLFESISQLDILINAAGIIRRDEEFAIDAFQQVLDINLTGTMRTCLAAKAKLATAQGCIVNLASMLSFFGAPRTPAYSASKGAVSQLTRSLAIAWAPDKIRVNAVAPGWIATPLTQALQDDPQRSAQLMARTPLARWGRPNEVAAAVLFLCSEAASFITGAILPVDGGYSAA